MASQFIESLLKSIWSFVGSKQNLTPNFAESVCSIIEDRPIEKQPGYSSERMESTGCDKDVDESTLKLRGELASLEECLSHLNLLRREALNDYLNLKGNIRVFCRVRGFLPDEGYHPSNSVITTVSCNLILKIAENKSKQYSFDKVFHSHSTQDEVFSEIEPVIKSALDGYNVCIFAYGQTGTGKTYTMEGKPDCPGVVPRGIEALFQQALDSNCKFLFSFSMLEIYMGNLRDLLVPQHTKTKVAKAPRLSIQTEPNGDIEIENLASVKVSDFKQAKRLYKLGSRSRTTASTMSNSTSSRSHCLIRISITCLGAKERRRESNKIWMVDLGGSERMLKTQATGRRLEEGKAINLSLSSLGDVINALQNKKYHVPYRNSKLTQVLKDSLGSDSKALMLTHVSSKEEDMCETLCSLGFASRVKSIHLGSDEPHELRVEKEVQLAKLLQKVKSLDSDREDIKSQIKRHLAKLKYFGIPDTLEERRMEYSVQSTEGPQYSGTETARNLEGYTENTTSLPRFMRPTACSKKKAGMYQQTKVIEGKKPSQKRKTSLVHAPTEIAPTKSGEWQSGNRPNYSISTGSCSALKDNTYNGSECSQIGSEDNTENIVFTEQAKSLKRSLNSCHEGANKTESSVVDNTDQNKQTIRNQRRIQMNTKTTTSSIQSKSVLAIPIERAGDMSNEKRHNLTCKIGTRNPGKGNNKLHNYFTNKASNFSQSVTEARSSVMSNMTEMVSENQSFLVNLSSCIAESEHNQSAGVEQTWQKVLPEQQEAFAEITNIVVVGGDSSRIQREFSAFHDDIVSGKSYSEEFSRSQQPTKEVDRTSLGTMRSRRKLFMEKDLQKLEQDAALGEPIVHITNDQEEKYNRGACQVLRQTIQFLWAIAIVLGLHSSGFDNDFFHGLVL